MTITLHKGDLPKNVKFGSAVAVDTETMGLNSQRDRLCLIQLSSGDGSAHLVQFAAGQYDAPNLKALLSDPKTQKIFHFARFDVAAIRKYLDVATPNIYCTRIGSYLARTFTDRHGLKDLCRELLDIEINKQQQSSDWGAETLTKEQLEYAANDVLFLHKLRDELETMLVREGRQHLAKASMDFIQTRADLDLAGWPEVDIFAH